MLAMPYFDRFDICEAYLALEMDWNQGGMLRERPGRFGVVECVANQLHRMHFKPRYSFNGYESLTENGKAIYAAFLEKHRMCSGCDGSCFDSGRSCDEVVVYGPAVPCSVCLDEHGREIEHASD